MDISQIRGTVLFISAFLSLVFAFLFWFRYKGEEKTFFYFGWVAFFSAVYCFSYGGIFFFENKLFWSRATWLGVLILPSFITSLYYSYLPFFEVRYLKLKALLWYLGGIIIVLITLTTPLIIKDVSLKYPYPDTAGPLKLLGRLYIVLSLIVGLFHLFRVYFQTKGLERWRTKLVILGAAIYAIGGLLFAGIAPLFSPRFSSYTDLSAISSTIWVGLASYAILKREPYPIKVILTEFLVVVTAVVLLIQALLSQTAQVRIFGFVIFLLFLLVGYLLIRVTRGEVERKEEAETLAQELKKLNETLEERVKKRTGELEKSYQEIKKRKDELEKFYKLAVGRELKMVELKKEFKELKKKLEST